MTTPLALAGRADFRQFYAAGAMIRAGDAKQLYSYSAQKEFQDRLVSREQTALPFVSPAYHAFLFAPFSFLPYRAAYFVFLALNIATLGICFVLLQPWTGNLRIIYSWLPYAMFLGFMPIVMTLIQGQDSILLTTLLTGAFVLLMRGRDTSAGLLTGLGLFKFPVVLPMALLFLIWRRWRFFLGFATCATALASVSVWLTGIVQTKVYITSLISIAGLRPPVSDLSRYPITLQQMANLHGLVFGIGNGWAPKVWLQAVTLVASGAVLVWTAFRGLTIKSAPRQFLLAVPCSSLVGHHTYIHDLSVLLLPAIVLLDSFLPSEADGNRKRRLIGWAAAAMFFAPVLESFSPNYFYIASLAVLSLLVGVAEASKVEYLSGSECPV